MEKDNMLSRSIGVQKDAEHAQGNHITDSTEEDGSDSDNDTFVLKAVNSIIERSLKRTRVPRKIKTNKRTKVVRDRRQGRQVLDKDVSTARSRYHASYLIQVMKDFDDKQRALIREIDFGAILQLDGGSVPWSFVQWLAEHVDVSSQEMTFHGKPIDISIESFGHVLGVPTTGSSVPPECKFTTTEFLGLFGLSEMPSIKYFGDKIIAKGQSNDDFLRCFMTVAMATFYCPTSSTKPSTAYLGGIIHVDKIKSYNWGEFLHNWTLWYIKKYQTVSSTLALCNYYIAVRYLDFLDFGSLEIESTLPRICVWKGDMIKEYIKLDMDDDNFYGKLPIKHIMQTCYAQARSYSTAPRNYSLQRLRQSIESFQQSAFTDKIKDDICCLFQDYTHDETITNCSKVQELLSNVLECLVNNNCFLSSSQSTQKLSCSSQDENKSNGVNDESGDTLKLPSTETTNSERRYQVTSERYCGSQQSNNQAVSHGTTKSLTEEEDRNIATTDQIIQRQVEPADRNDLNSNKDTSLYHVNTALGNLQIKENYQTGGQLLATGQVETTQERIEEYSSVNSASLQHLLNVESETAVGNSDAQTSEGNTNLDLNNSPHINPSTIPEYMTPQIPHAKFSGNNINGKECSDSTKENHSPYTSSTSIQCAQKTHPRPNQIMASIDLNMMNSQHNRDSELSSQTRIQSYSSIPENESIHNMNILDFEIDDGQPSIPFMDSWLASPRNQVIRSMKKKKLEQQLNSKNKNTELQQNFNTHLPNFAATPSPQRVSSPLPLDSPQRVQSCLPSGSLQEGNSVGYTASPRRTDGNDTIVISSQESPEVRFMGEKHGSPNRTPPTDDEEVVYIGNHRLSPVRRKTSEQIDRMYDETNASNMGTFPSSSTSAQFTNPLPPRRMVPPSRYVSSPYDVVLHNFTPTPKQIQLYEAIVQFANSDETKLKTAIQIGTCSINLEIFGNSLKPGGHVESWVINLYSRILFKNSHPKESNRHTFFHTSSEYFLEKWENEGRRLNMKDQVMKAFEGAGKAKKLHLTDSLHFPSLYNVHWFLFTVDIRDKKFMFMDSLFDKDSSLHQEVDNRMIKNFKEIWNECRLKTVDFTEFEILHLKVPQQNKEGKDGGIHVMKNIEYFKPRNTLMGTYSSNDIPNIRVQIANNMMFSRHNELVGMQEAIREFNPSVHSRYTRMM